MARKSNLAAPLTRETKAQGMVHDVRPEIIGCEENYRTGGEC